MNPPWPDIRLIIQAWVKSGSPPLSLLRKLPPANSAAPAATSFHISNLSLSSIFRSTLPLSGVHHFGLRAFSLDYSDLHSLTGSYTCSPSFAAASEPVLH